ncbi:unnamed protein product [Calypogeia fissa]
MATFSPAPPSDPTSAYSPAPPLESKLSLPDINLYPFIPSLIGAFVLSSYLIALVLKQNFEGRKLRLQYRKQDPLKDELEKVLKGIVGDDEADNSNRKRSSVAVKVGRDGNEMLGAEVFQAQTLSWRLQELCRKIAIILASERSMLSFLIPRWKWSTRAYIISLITEKKKSSKVADETVCSGGSLVSVPVSITHIRNKIAESTSDRAGLEGTTTLAKACKDAGFQGAQLAIVCKALSVMQDKLEGRWNMSLRIVRFTAANLLTIYAFWYTSTNSIRYLAYYYAGELVAGVYTQPLVGWLVPKLDYEIGNIVMMLKLRLEQELLVDFSEHKPPNEGEEAYQEEFLQVKEWMSCYFTKFNEVKELLNI